MAQSSNSKTLQDLLVHALKDIYYAENAISKALPKIIKQVKHEELSEALTDHLEETKEHITRLEDIFGELDMKPEAVKCEAIEGILKEGDEVLEEFGGSPAGDAAIVFACQAVEHYEINRYGSMHAWATELGLETIAELLEETLEEEHNADETLSQLAESEENEAGIVRTAAKAAA